VSRFRALGFLPIGPAVVLGAAAIALPAGGADAASPVSQLTIVSPGSGQTISGSVSWQVAVSGATTTEIDFLVDGATVASKTSSPFTIVLDTTKLSDGKHTFSVTAPTNQRKSGRVASVAITVTVANTAATIATPAGLPSVGIAAGADMQNWSSADVGRELDDYAKLHAHWIRHDFAWDAIEPLQGGYTWAGFDRLVSAARARGIHVIATITYTPAWANGGHSDHDYAPTSADQFGRFAGEVAARYAPQGLHAYEIWNEPNIGYWLPTPDPAAYTHVLCAAYKYIHAADPNATVITGGTSPAGDGSSTYSPQTWLADLYADGAQPCFDAVGHHPYVDAWSNWDAMASYTTNLRQIEIAHGDAGKRIWATEVGCNRYTLGDTECSNRLSQAFQLWKSYSWAGALAWFTYWDPNVYGLVDRNWTPRPEWYAYQQAAGVFG
jgi:hypothetical protein